MIRVLLLFWLWFPLMGQAQTTVQVVTRVVDKDLPYTAGQSIVLAAQKADIAIRGWNRPTVSVRLRLVAKHPDRAVAERELAYHQYTLQAGSKGIELGNHFSIPGGKAQSQLKVSYELNVPEKALLSLSNTLGDIQLHGVVGETSLKFEFGKLTLQEIAGKLTITSSYGDIDGQNLDATLTLKAEKADVTLRNLGGACRLTSHYGRLTLQPNAQTLKALSVEAARAEVTLQVRSLTDFRYDVITTYADIRVPDNLTDELSKFGGKQTFTYEPPGRKTELVIRNSYGNVLIQSDKSVVNR